MNYVWSRSRGGDRGVGTWGGNRNSIWLIRVSFFSTVFVFSEELLLYFQYTFFESSLIVEGKDLCQETLNMTVIVVFSERALLTANIKDYDELASDLSQTITTVWDDIESTMDQSITKSVTDKNEDTENVSFCVIFIHFCKYLCIEILLFEVLSIKR